MARFSKSHVYKPEPVPVDDGKPARARWLGSGCGLPRRHWLQRNMATLRVLRQLIFHHIRQHGAQPRFGERRKRNAQQQQIARGNQQNSGLRPGQKRERCAAGAQHARAPVEQSERQRAQLPLGRLNRRIARRELDNERCHHSHSLRIAHPHNARFSRCAVPVNPCIARELHAPVPDSPVTDQKTGIHIELLCIGVQWTPRARLTKSAVCTKKICSRCSASVCAFASPNPSKSAAITSARAVLTLTALRCGSTVTKGASRAITSRENPGTSNNIARSSRKSGCVDGFASSASSFGSVCASGG